MSTLLVGHALLTGILAALLVLVIGTQAAARQLRRRVAARPERHAVSRQLATQSS